MLIRNYCLRPNMSFKPNFKTPNKIKSQPKNTDSISFKGNNTDELTDFVYKYSRMIHPDKTTENDVNLTFFGIRKVDGTPIEEFKRLIAPIKNILNTTNRELSYIELGGLLGDQEVALRTMGLGHILGEWKVLSPDIMLPTLPKNIKMDMAGMGMVTIIKNNI